MLLFLDAPLSPQILPKAGEPLKHPLAFSALDFPLFNLPTRCPSSFNFHYE